MQCVPAKGNHPFIIPIYSLYTYLFNCPSIRTVTMINNHMFLVLGLTSLVHCAPSIRTSRPTRRQVGNGPFNSPECPSSAWNDPQCATIKWAALGDSWYAHLFDPRQQYYTNRC